MTISVAVAGLTSITRSISFFGLSCRERSAAQGAVLAAVVIEPQVTHSLTGRLVATHLVTRETTEPPQNFSGLGSDKCDDGFRVDRQWCVPDEGAVTTRAEVRVNSANCRSGFEGVVPSGPRCVLARGVIGGCGADRGPFNVWLGCKGRGWLDYDITLSKSVQTREEAGRADVRAEPSVAQRSWSFPFPAGSEAPEHTYEVTIARTKVSRVLETPVLTHANPNSGPFASRVASGTLAVEIVGP